MALTNYKEKRNFKEGPEPADGSPDSKLRFVIQKHDASNLHYNALERIKCTGDIFKPVLGKGINLEKVIKIFSKE